MPASTKGIHRGPTDSRYQKLRRGVRGPSGLTRKEVREHQRTRIYEATVEIAATRGYHATTIKAICSLAGVSRQTFYDLFGTDKQACILGAYDYVVNRAAGRVNLAYLGEENPERRLIRALEQFALEAASEPAAARFTLLEMLGAGPAAFERMDRGRAMFEAMIRSSPNERAVGETLSPTISKGIVGGVERITRLYLLAGRIGELPAQADELTAWACSYRAWQRPPPADRQAQVSRPHPTMRGKDERLRTLRAAATIAARDGYSSLSAGRIARLAGVGEETFARLHGADIGGCFLAAFDLVGVEALVSAARASRHAISWADGAHSGITALMDHIAGDPFVGRLAFIEILSAGPSAIERRSSLMKRFTDQLIKTLPPSQRPSELVAEAIVGGIWAIVHDYVARGQVHRLHELADDASYLALAPIIGHDHSVEVIGGSRSLLAPAAGRDAGRVNRSLHRHT
jgi:AcrR family transcriptional regulator